MKKTLRLLKDKEEIIILDDTCEIMLHRTNMDHYAELGYNFDRTRIPLEVDVWDVTFGSHYKLKVQCPDCGKVYKSWVQTISRSGNTLCRPCATTKGKTKNEKGKVYNRLTVKEMYDNRPYKTARWLCICECGNEVIVNSSDLRYGHTKSCGCYREELKRKRSGSNHYRWNPDRDGVNERRVGAEYKEWKEEVNSRDGNECIICGDDANVSTHHLYNANGNKDLNIDIENGLTLCHNHHYSFHSWMGTTSTPCTPKDFFEYLHNEVNWSMLDIAKLIKETNVYITGDL